MSHLDAFISDGRLILLISRFFLNWERLSLHLFLLSSIMILALNLWVRGLAGNIWSNLSRRDKYVARAKETRKYFYLSWLKKQWRDHLPVTQTKLLCREGTSDRSWPPEGHIKLSQLIREDPGKKFPGLTFFLIFLVVPIAKSNQQLETKEPKGSG